MKKFIFPLTIILVPLILYALFSLLSPLFSHPATFPPNTTIVPAQGDYAYENTTNNFQTQFKDNPTAKNSIVFENNLGDISFYTPATQSFGDLSQGSSPTTDGSTLTYPEIFPQIDIKYTISSTRLLEEFIVKDAATATQITRIEQRATTKSTYVENDDGSITFYNKDKEVFTLPHPVMYETGNTGAKSEGIVYEINPDGDQLIITKVITEEGRSWLADPARLYPIAIDLVIDNADSLTVVGTVIDNGDTSGNWTSSDPTPTTVSQETTIKQEGTGSVKVQTTAGGAPVNVDLMEYSSDGTVQAAFVTNSATANGTGGTITSSGGYTIHTFTSSGTFTPPATMNVEVLVVAGGGGGTGSTTDGQCVVGGGGGGAGGLVYNASFAVTSGAKTVTIGAGGAGGILTSACQANSGSNGVNSVFDTLTANGGGRGGGGGSGSTGGSGGSGGGGVCYNSAGGIGSQGNNGGIGCNGSPYRGGGGGGAGEVGTSGDGGAHGGAGATYSISGSSIIYAGGGGGGSINGGSVGSGGSGGGGSGGDISGSANTGGGGGGGRHYDKYYVTNGGAGGSGIVIVRYLTPPYLQSYSEPTIKTQGSYALKGTANQTTSLNKTLTRTIGTPLNLSNVNSATFDLRASRTGSNIKVGLHDSGGTVTEVTPNITQADTFQSVTVDLSGVSNANKDAINQIIITIVNADAANTFYVDNMVATAPSSLNDTVTRTVSATDLSAAANITYWVRSSVAGSYATFGFGESAATEQTNTITIAQANTWEQKTWDISGIAAASKNAVTKYAFTYTGDTSGASFYFDDIQAVDPSNTWVSSDASATTVSEETTIKQEGSGSVKVQTTAGGTVNVDLMEYSSDGTAQAAFVTNSATANATGGTITSSGGYTIHKFTSSGTFTSIPGVSSVRALVVAGGGGGGRSKDGWGGSGGGGAGGYLYNSSLAVTTQSYSVTVGGGGGGGAGGAAGGAGANGGNSVFSTITATGGGGGGAGGVSYGTTGGSGGGGAYYYIYGGSGTAGQGNGGGTGLDVNVSPYNGGSGGGAGGAGRNGNTVGVAVAIAGGAGVANSISGSSVTYSVGGSTNIATTHGAANTGNGGSGEYGSGYNGGNGGSGIVIISYVPPTNLQSYSEATIKTQGTYALKGVAPITNSLNKTLTRTIASPLNLSDKPSVTFDLRASRTGSNIKVGLHDSGGTTTEVTPNITSANTFQSATIDLSAVINANKDAIDQIIITIVNADAANTFYIDNMVATAPTSLNDTVTRSTAATDLSGVANITYWVRSSVAGSFATFGFGESAATEQANTITINEANTWEQKSWNIEGITGTARDAVTKFAFTFTGDTSGASFYFDDIQTNALFTPTLGTATSLSDTSIRWNFTDNSNEETGFKIYDSTGTTVLVTCASTNLTYCDETGLTPNTQYTRKISAYNTSSTSITSGTVSGYTLAAVPAIPALSTRVATTISINPDPASNSAGTQMAIYKETGTTCDGSGGSYIAANGSDNGATAVWQTDAQWSTVTATGLSGEQAYSFCIKARNGDNVETAFSPVGSYNAGFIPLGGNYICAQDTVNSSTFTNRYVDGSNPARYVIALDAGTGTTNSAVFEAKSCIMTLNSTDTLVTGSLSLTGGSIAIATGGQIKIASPVWAIDADADGYTADTKLYYGDQPVGGVRKNAVTTLATPDCGDSTYSTSNVCCTVATRYQDADGDTYGNPSVSISACTTAGYVDNNTDCNDASASLYRTVAGYLDSDGDGYGAGAYTTCAGASGSYVANNTDCYNANANAKPGSTYCSATNRGDGSYDYNCTGGSTKCGNAYYVNQVRTLYGNEDPPRCVPIASYNTSGAQSNCGQAGYMRNAGGWDVNPWGGLYDGVEYYGSYCSGGGVYKLGTSGTQACQ